MLSVDEVRENARNYLDQAEKQLSYALKLIHGDYLTSAKINQRLADIAQMRAQMDA